MTMQADNIVIRIAKSFDGEGVTRLFCEDGTNPYGWSAHKWRHYYVDYPDGQPVAVVAEINGDIVGHYGMVPVVIGTLPAMLGLHAYVSVKYRGLTIISALMTEVDRICKAKGVAVICGFANPRFSLIKKTFFKWNTPFWLGFKKGAAPTDTVRGDAKFYFQYSDAWYPWRFGEDRNFYLSCFVDTEGNVRKQLLKIRDSNYNDENLSDSECWSKSMMYARDQESQFCQPFSVKVYDRSLIDLGILQPENWFIEMGDSDTFSYISWSEK